VPKPHVEEEIASITGGVGKTAYPPLEKAKTRSLSLILYRKQFKMDQTLM
jgi:hypothetical protein